LNIKDEQTHAMARKLADLTGETMSKAVKIAIEERLVRCTKKKGSRGIAAKLNRLADYCATLPVYDDRTPDEIIGYDEYGLPK
ncbi:MAG: type II toxin-antitoxin system VapB family antitoxin, partial [Rhodospirillaceae bacterium]|nr:type II toxin-antitoxin system VapB family antitoxin [Rhodospirillaceae bacterium]